MGHLARRVLTSAALAAALVVTLPVYAQTVVPPVLRSDPSALYPEGASGEATVILTLTVAADGSVSAAVPDRENEPFSSRAVDTARAWTFDPATRDGAPVASKIKVEIVFRPPVIVPDPDEEARVQAEAVAAAEARAAAAKKLAGNAAVPIEEQVTVRGERVEPGRSATLSRTEVRQIPGTFGDPFRAIEIMPGVTPVVSGLPFFFIRGAPPGNVGYFLDGVRVPLLFHVGIGPSAVHPALISRVDLYPGGYPARFGRFSGGIVSGEVAPPATEAHGEGNLRLFDVGALAETPIANGKGAVLLGGRYSYTALAGGCPRPKATARPTSGGSPADFVTRTRSHRCASSIRQRWPSAWSAGPCS